MRAREYEVRFYLKGMRGQGHLVAGQRHTIRVWATGVAGAKREARAAWAHEIEIVGVTEVSPEND